jgi:hypothetical protein
VSISVTLEDAKPRLRLLGVRAYALVELGDPEAIDLFLREEDAQAALENALHDEPGWAGTLRVEAVELDEAGHVFELGGMDGADAVHSGRPGQTLERLSRAALAPRRRLQRRGRCTQRHPPPGLQPRKADLLKLAQSVDRGPKLA